MGQDNQDSLWLEKGVVGWLWPVLVHRATPTSMPGLGRTTWGQTGNQLQGLAGHLGAGPRGHHCTSFRQQEQAQPRSVGKWWLVLTPGTEGLIQGIKDKEHLRHPGKLDFTEQLLSLSSPCNCLTQICHRDAGPHPCFCITDVLPGQGEWSPMCETLTGKNPDSTCLYQCALRRKAAW